MQISVFIKQVYVLNGIKPKQIAIKLHTLLKAVKSINNVELLMLNISSTENLECSYNHEVRHNEA